MIQPVSRAHAFDIDIEMVPPGATPEQELEKLEAHAQNGGAQHLDAVVLDADERGLENAVKWVRTFNDEYLRRQAATYPDAWENALQPQPRRALRPLPPVLVVLASPSGPGGDLGEFEAELAGGGAVVYEKPSRWEMPANFVDRLREIAESLLAARRKMEALLALAPGWDSYSATAIERDRAIAALGLIWLAIANGAPMPAIVPTSDGGIQLEWHRRGVDLEIRVISETSFEVYFEDLSKQETQELEIAVDFSPLKVFLDRVTGP
jgi:hypothetical protein